jgi:zinc/manganese transport system permease protein
LLGLIAAPAGAAHRLTSNPYLALALSTGLAVLAMWLGLVLSYAIPSLPPSTAIIATATACYLLAFLFQHRARGGQRRSAPDSIHALAQNRLRMR